MFRPSGAVTRACSLTSSYTTTIPFRTCRYGICVDKMCHRKQIWLSLRDRCKFDGKSNSGNYIRGQDNFLAAEHVIVVLPSMRWPLRSNRSPGWQRKFFQQQQSLKQFQCRVPINHRVGLPVTSVRQIFSSCHFFSLRRHKNGSAMASLKSSRTEEHIKRKF